MNHYLGIPAPAGTFGLAGLLPFVAGAAFSWFDSTTATPTIGVSGPTLLLTYGAVILSFLGGIRWGVAMQHGQLINNWTVVAWAMVPSLLAWTAILVSPKIGLPVLATGLILQFVVDFRSTKTQITPPWFLKLRVILTVGAVTAILFGWLSVIYSTV